MENPNDPKNDAGAEGEPPAVASEEGFTCPVCGEGRPLTQAMHGDLIRHGVQRLIQGHRAEWQPGDLVCLPCLNHCRASFVEDVLETEKGELSELEREAVQSLQEQEILAANLNIQFDRQLTAAERASDAIAKFGGSWRFILSFGVAMAIWITINSVLAKRQPFDPYPFILLNLILSCLAALQAPIIMMSQNREEPEPAGGEGPDARRARLQGEPEGGA